MKGHTFHPALFRSFLATRLLFISLALPEDPGKTPQGALREAVSGERNLLLYRPERLWRRLLPTYYTPQCTPSLSLSGFSKVLFTASLSANWLFWGGCVLLVFFPPPGAPITYLCFACNPANAVTIACLPNTGAWPNLIQGREKQALTLYSTLNSALSQYSRK